MTFRCLQEDDAICNTPCEEEGVCPGEEERAASPAQIRGEELLFPQGTFFPLLHQHNKPQQVSLLCGARVAT